MRITDHAQLRTVNPFFYYERTVVEEFRGICTVSSLAFFVERLLDWEISGKHEQAIEVRDRPFEADQ